MKSLAPIYWLFFVGLRKKKYYVVWKGRRRGVLHSWEACRASVHKVRGAQYRSFNTLAQAEEAFSKGPPPAPAHAMSSPRRVAISGMASDLHGVAVDAACSGNPGLMEYRGVDIGSGEELFRKGPFESGTNNIGEFLAIVHALAALKKTDDSRPVYSDSRIAMGWVKSKKVQTTLPRTLQSEPVFVLIDRALDWLAKNNVETRIVKWNTAQWGEIPADFGRK